MDFPESEGRFLEEQAARDDISVRYVIRKAVRLLMMVERRKASGEKILVEGSDGKLVELEIIA